jgi:hypothetical protein
MVEAASDALQMYDTNEHVRKAVSAFFGVEPGYSQNDVETVTSMISLLWLFLFHLRGFLCPVLTCRHLTRP